jgi:hypothetical protein
LLRQTESGIEPDGARRPAKTLAFTQDKIKKPAAPIGEAGFPEK